MTEPVIPLTIWMNIPSFYQNDLFEALAASGQVELQVIFARNVPQDRVNLGWTIPATDRSYRFLNERSPVLDAIRIAWRHRRRLHIVNGIWAEPAFAAALSVLRLTGAQYAVYAEAPDPRPTSGHFKRTLKMTFGRWIARNARASVLAISHYARHFYSALGFADERIYEFGYFRAGYVPSDNGIKSGKTGVEVFFVGQLVERKGIDLLVAAVQPLFGAYPELHLTLVGDGIERAVLEQSVRDAGCQNRIVFEGMLSSDRVRERMANADALVLPSRWDGWGVVVNEAFSVGIPVIVSDACGAADLVRHGENGYVFRSGDVQSLRECLRRFVDSAANRTRLRAVAAETGLSISSDAVAPYLVKCLRHMMDRCADKPVPPWKGQGFSKEVVR
jgi:glycosyltransferase involved in cell wall biosynthesis